MLGIPLALLGAVFLAFGAQYQSRGLNKVERLTGKSAAGGLSKNHVAGLLKRPSWIIGTVLLGLATVLQLGSLSFSPIVVVQPIGIIALLITALLNTKFSGVRLGRKAKIAILLNVLGITFFVLIATLVTENRVVTTKQLLTVLVLFGVLLSVSIIAYLILRKRAAALFYIVGAGVIYGFVATFAKLAISSFLQGTADLYTWLAIVALLLGTALGMLFVQNAYASGPPDLVVAGLTVIDPLVAVFLGILILGEAANATVVAIFGFVVTGSIAMVGVVSLAKHHPQTGLTALATINTAGIPVVIEEE